jgi:hypothetical protein
MAELGSSFWGLGLEVDGPGLLAGAVQYGEPAGLADERQTLTVGQGVEQGRGPDVLVDIGAGEHDSNITLNQLTYF